MEERKETEKTLLGKRGEFACTGGEHLINGQR